MWCLPSQESGTQRVKCRDPHVAAIDAQERFDARPHFFRGLVGEGDGKDPVGIREAFADEIGDAMSDDAGLAGTRPGKNQQRPFGLKDRCSLFRVEA